MWILCRQRGGSFESCRGDATDKGPLRQKEKDKDGEQNEGGSGHQMVPGGSADRSLKSLQTQSQGVLIFPGEEDKGAKKIIPRGHKLKQGDRQKGGLGEGQNDLPEDPEFATSVDPGGFGKISGDRKKELTQEKDIKGSSQKGGDPEGLEGPDPSYGLEKSVDGDHHDGKGDHHRRQKNKETGIPAAPIQSGEPIRHEGAGENRADHIQKCKEQAVSCIEPEGAHRTHRIRIVVPLGGGREPLGGELHRFVQWFQRGGDHPEKWEKKKNPKKDQSHTGKPRDGGSGGLHGSAARVVDFFLPITDAHKTQCDDQHKEAEGEGGGVAHVPVVKGILIYVGGQKEKGSAGSVASSR